MAFEFHLIIVVDFMGEPKGKYYLPVIIWAVLMMIVSSIPNLGPQPLNFTYGDKIEHFIEYAILGFLLSLALFKTRSRPILLVAIAICAAYGIIDELHQLFVPGRDADPFDALADIIGSAAGVGIYALLKNRFVLLSLRHPRSDSVK